MKRHTLCAGLALALGCFGVIASCGGKAVLVSGGPDASDDAINVQPYPYDGTIPQPYPYDAPFFYDAVHRRDAIVSFDVGPPPPMPDASPPPPFGCDPNTPFTPYPWAPPTPFSNACTTQQLTDYYNCLTGGNGDCSAFRGVAGNAGCVACLETDVNAPAHGPLLTETMGGVVYPVTANYGGCEAALDGDTSATGCGATFQAIDDCQGNDCAGCSDASNPMPGGPFYACVQQADGSGTCSPYHVSMACYAELDDGGVAASCAATFQGFLAEWCGNPAFGG